MTERHNSASGSVHAQGIVPPIDNTGKIAIKEFQFRVDFLSGYPIPRKNGSNAIWVKNPTLMG